MKKFQLRLAKKVILLIDTDSTEDHGVLDGIALGLKFEEQGFLVDLVNYKKYEKNFLLNKFSSTKCDDLPSIIFTVSSGKENQFLDEDLIWVRENTNCILLSVLGLSPCPASSPVVVIYSHTSWIIDKSVVSPVNPTFLKCCFLPVLDSL